MDFSQKRRLDFYKRVAPGENFSSSALSVSGLNQPILIAHSVVLVTSLRGKKALSRYNVLREIVLHLKLQVDWHLTKISGIFETIFRFQQQTIDTFTAHGFASSALACVYSVIYSERIIFRLALAGRV